MAAPKIMSVPQESRGTRLRRLRAEAGGLSLEMLARKAGVTRGVLSMWERGTVEKPGGENLENVAKALGTTAAYILRGDPRDRYPSRAGASMTDEVSLLESYRRIPVELRTPLRQIMQALAGK